METRNKQNPQYARGDLGQDKLAVCVMVILFAGLVVGLIGMPRNLFVSHAPSTVLDDFSNKKSERNDPASTFSFYLNAINDTSK